MDNNQVLNNVDFQPRHLFNPEDPENSEWVVACAPDPDIDDLSCGTIHEANLQALYYCALNGVPRENIVIARVETQYLPFEPTAQEEKESYAELG